MKKILFLLLLITSVTQGQTTLANKLKITGNVENTTPAFIGTQETDGIVNKIPSAYIEKTANKTSTITGYSETLYPNEKATHDGLDMKLNISDLPTNLTLYPTTAVSDVAGYIVMVTDIHDVDYNTVAVDVSTPLITTTNQLISQRISAAGVLIGQPGVFNITTFGNIRHLSGSGTASFYFEVYQRTSAGVETLICTSSNSLPVTNGGYSEFSASGVWDDGTFLATDRIVIKSYANRIAGGSDPVYQFQFGGVSPVRTILPVPFSVVDAGYELSANKVSTLTASDVLYPNNNAVIAGLATKQNTLTNPITGTGTANTFPIFTGTTTLGNSILTQTSLSVKASAPFSSSTVAPFIVNNETPYSSPFNQHIQFWQSNNVSIAQLRADGLFTLVPTDSNMSSGFFTARSAGTATGVSMRLGTNNTGFFLPLANTVALSLAGTERVRFHSNGNTSFNTSTDNGQGVAQFNGNITISDGTLANHAVTKGQLDLKSNLASPTFTGVPSVPTASVGTNTTQIASTAFVYSVSNWTKTGNDIRNNNTGEIQLKPATKISILNSVSSETAKITETGNFIAKINSNGFFGSDENSGMFFDGNNLNFRAFGNSNFRFNPIFLNQTTGVNNDVIGFSNQTINPTSGSINFNMLNISPIVNQTGGANGITRSLYINPTLTSAFDYRAIEVTAGKTILQETKTLDLIVSNLGGGPSRIVSADVNGELSASSIFTHDGQIAVTNSVSANSFIKTGGTSSQFLKADGSIDESDIVKNIVKDASQGANVTGTVSETILYSKLIPANTFKDGDFINMFSRIARPSPTSSSGGVTHRIKINTSNTLTGAILIATNTLTAGVSGNQVGTLIRNFTLTSGTIKGSISTQGYPSDLINLNSPIESNTFNPAVDNYIFITGILGFSGDTMYNLGTKITN